MDATKLVGYRVVEFSLNSKDALKAIAERLIPHQESIIAEWIQRQTNAWEPPNLSRKDLENVFRNLFNNILCCMQECALETCIDDLESAGAALAEQQFPFEALVVSVHFLEESYLPYLLNPPHSETQNWLIAMDEFLHAALAAIATSYFEAYRRELLDRAEVGRIVQEGLLADIPKRAADLEIAHVYISARERAQLGGDFLDFFTIGQGCAAFLIGDLSGHGLEAAADSLMLRSLFRGFMRENADLADAMSRVNRVLFSELESNQFATALAVSYDLSGKLSIVSAGHPCPVVCNGECSLLEISGLPLAVDDNTDYKVVETELKPGGVFLAYTDGLIESGISKEMFGEERVLKGVAEVYNNSARAVAEHLIDLSLRHAGGRFEDDVAVLALRRGAASAT